MATLAEFTVRFEAFRIGSKWLYSGEIGCCATSTLGYAHRVGMIITAGRAGLGDYTDASDGWSVVPAELHLQG
ncbi:hypothetical protein, partial [Staphylococcus aureus]